MGIFQKRKNKHRKLLLFLCILIACMFLWTKDGKAENNEVTPEILRVGYSAKFLNDVSLADAQVAIELWTRQLTNNAALKMQPKPYIYDDLQSMVHALKNREIDFIAITAMDYLKIKDKVPLEPTLVGNKWRAAHGDELVLVVRREQQITDIGQLKGKRLMVHANLMLDSAYLWLSTVLTGKSLPERERFFGSVREVRKASQAVLPVFFKQADGCLVNKSSFDTMVELNPQIEKEMMVFLSSDKLLHGMFCFHRHLSADIKTQMTKTALNIHTTPAGKQILTLFQIDTIMPFKPSMLDTTVALLDKRDHIEGRLMIKKRREL